MNTLRIAKIGKNAETATDPKDFIFSADYNTPKIIKEDIHSPTLGTTGSEQFTGVSHSLGYTPLVMGFCKFENNRVGLVGTKASDEEFFFTNLHVGATDVNFGYQNNTGGNYQPYFKYLATEIPLAGTPSIAQQHGTSRLIISKPGFNAETETNPNNIVFDSRWGTLKYYVEGTATIDVPSTTPAAGVSDSYEVEIYSHNLGYYPFFGASAELTVLDPGRIYIMPMTFADAGFWAYDMLYVNASKLIYRAEYGNSFGGFGGGGYQIKIYYKIYSRNLGL